MNAVPKQDDAGLSLDQCENGNGGRRSGAERRKFSYTLYIPERRSGRDRRKKPDRRKGDNDK